MPTLLSKLTIAHLVFNAKINGVGQAVITGFSQVVQSKEIRKFFERGREISLSLYFLFFPIISEPLGLYIQQRLKYLAFSSGLFFINLKYGDWIFDWSDN